MNHKPSLIALSCLAGLLLFSTFSVAFAAATPSANSISPDSAFAKLGKGSWTSATDNFGNVYTFTHTPHTHPYAYTGQVVSSPYLPDLPWSLSGTQRGNNFKYTATDSNPSNGFCSYQFKGTFSSATTASGTWVNLPTGTTGCGQTGTFSLTPGGAGPVITLTGGRPGVAS